MTLPFCTTMVTVLRPEGSPEPYQGAGTLLSIATHVRAHISLSHGVESVRASQEVIFYRLDTDVCDITHLDKVIDETTFTVYEVLWVAKRIGLGIDHMEAGLNLIDGVH